MAAVNAESTQLESDKCIKLEIEIEQDKIEQDELNIQLRMLRAIEYDDDQNDHEFTEREYNYRLIANTLEYALSSLKYKYQLLECKYEELESKFEDQELILELQKLNQRLKKIT